MTDDTGRTADSGAQTNLGADSPSIPPGHAVCGCSESPSPPSLLTLLAGQRR